MARKKKKRKTIGKMANSRREWVLNPVTRIKESKKKYDRQKEKQIPQD